MNHFTIYYDIRRYGAIGDGKALCTSAIQAAIDECREKGGGTVYITAGVYLTGTISLHSGITLYIDKSATLLASTDEKDYPELELLSVIDNRVTPLVCTYPSQALIYAANADNIGVTGGGKIEGQGGYGSGYFPVYTQNRCVRPTLILMEYCRYVDIESVTLSNAAFWSTRFVMCGYMNFNAVKVLSLDTYNGDGLDFCGGENVMISNCVFEAGDDCIALKAFRPEHICRRFTVTNCIFTSKWAGIRMGPEAEAEMLDIAVSNCVFESCGDGIKIEACGGKVFENFLFSNLIMRNVERPVFAVLNSYSFLHEPTCRPAGSVLRNITIRDLTVTVSRDEKYERLLMRDMPGITFSGTMNDRISNLTLDNIQIQDEGGFTDPCVCALDVPEFLDYTNLYAESCHMERPCVPASGIYMRHVENANLRHISISTLLPDVRPMLILDDVCGSSIFDVTGFATDMTSCVTLKVGCKELVESGYRVFPSNANIVTTAEASAEQTEIWAAGKTEARRIDEMFAQEAYNVDNARKLPLLSAFTPEPISTSETAATYIIETDLRSDNADKAAYLYMPYVIGNMEVYINGNGTAAVSRVLSPAYKHSMRYFYAVELTPHIEVPSAEPTKIKICLTGKEAGIYSPVEIRAN